MDIKPGSPYDINGACFNAELYVKKVLKVKKSQTYCKSQLCLNYFF